MTNSIRRSAFSCAAFAVALLTTADHRSFAARTEKAAAPKAPATPPPTGQVYTVDDAHSFVEFSVRLVGFNRVRGAFPQYTAHIYYDTTDVERSSVSVRLSVEGVSTHEAERDQHLESKDFFDAKRFPFIRFDSRHVRPDGPGFIAEGDLTIRDVTKPTLIPFAITSPLGPDPFGNPRFSAVGHLVLNRRDFDVKGPDFWNKAIGDSVEIEFEVGCRRWNYDRLGWGNPKRTSIGQRILETSEKSGMASALRESRDLWLKERTNPDWNFGLFEYIKCAGRLGQHDRPRDGADVLGQAIELRADSTDASDIAVLRCQRAELLLQAGDGAGARAELGRAESSDSTSTYARALRRAIGG
jgi:polyisoprenoid-binding protein YceI